MTIDFEQAKRAFEEYLDEYDREDDKIKLKIIHTYGVVKGAREITRRMEINQEDRQLAEIIALLHDIGRFEQIRQFDSFQPDTMDHAAYGAELLFGEKKLIRRFVKEESFDSIIYQAIVKHSDFKLEGIQDERALFHAKLIRDGDKLDNCRVKIEEAIEILLGCSPQEAGKGMISPKVWEACMRKESVLSADRVTAMDYWVSYVAQYYDINFPETYQIIVEQDYISKIVKRLCYTQPDTAKKMLLLEAEIKKYMESIIRIS